MPKILQYLHRTFLPLCKSVFVGVLILAGLMPGQTFASENGSYILERAYWQDDSTLADFDSAQKQIYTPYQGDLSRGYTDSAHWVRLRIAASERPIGLRITPAWLDEVTVHDPLSPAFTVKVGDHYPVHKTIFRALGHTIELRPHNSPRDIWLRLKTTSTHRLHLEVQSIDELAWSITQEIFWASMHSAILLLMLVVLMSVWWVQRDRVLGAYLLRHISFTYYGFAFLGMPTLLLSDWLPPAFFDNAFSISVTTTIFLGARFDIAFLSTYNPNPNLLRMFKAASWLSLGLLILLLMGYERLALQLTIHSLQIIIVLLLAVAWSCKPDASTVQLIPRKVILGYYFLLMGVLFFALLGIVGWMQNEAWTLYILIVHGMVTGLAMTVILFLRGQRQTLENQRTEWQLQKAQKDIQLEQQRRNEQSQFLNMLMHELKTPLSVVSIALGTRGNRAENLALAGQAVQEMKTIIERCVQADRMGEIDLKQTIEKIDLQQMIDQLSQVIPGLKDRLQLNFPTKAELNSDRQLLQIVLSNLMDNAARYSDPLTPIEIVLKPYREQDQEGLNLLISNTPGVAGWPDSELLFNKFYRSSGAQRESGSGLGLFLAQHLAKSLRGRLSYRPTHHLVQFELWLPLNPI